MSSSFLLVAILSAVVLVEAGVLLDAPGTRIVGGHEIEIEDAPWQVSLQNNSQHKCGGSIISSRWVLSAAHCTEDLEKSLITIVIGTNCLKEGGTRYRVHEVVEHEKYTGKPYFMNDICVLKTETDMKLVLPVKTVTLPDPNAKRPEAKTQLRVSGWGELGNRTYPHLLRAVDVVVNEFTQCKPEDNPTEICAGTLDIGCCFGDSGGPLVKGDLQVGVVSHLHTGICGDGLDIYMHVAAYRPWIKTKTGV